MKWVVVAVALAAAFPLAEWLRRNPQQHPKVWMLMGALPFLIAFTPHLDIAPISWPAWPGYAKGIEFSLLDLLALAMFISLPRTSHPLPFRLSMSFYFFAVLLSVFQAPVPMAAAFYVWQLARVFLVYAVIARASTDERVVMALLKGLTIGLCFQACLVIWQRFGLGVLQASGSFAHQNFLGLVSHFVVLPVFALLLAGRWKWWTVAAPIAGLIVAVLTASRAAIGLTGAGLMLVFVLSAARKWTPAKAKIAMFGAIAAMVLVPLAISSLERRFEFQPLSDQYDERAAFERAASMIVADHPLGIGSNNYVPFANLGGYMERAGVVWGGRSRSTSVHNIYWLAAAETGYLGLLALVLLLWRIGATAITTGWRNRNDSRGDLLLGLGASVLIVSVHSYFEWIFFHALSQYLLGMTAGLVAGIAQQLRSHGVVFSDSVGAENRPKLGRAQRQS